MTPLTSWEYEELVQHLESRNDIWTLDEGLWIRTSRKPDLGDPARDACFALQFLEPEEQGPFRTWTYIVTPVSWSEPDIESYLENLFYYWTEYRARRDMKILLQNELQLDEATAHAASLMLAKAWTEPLLDPDQMPEPPKVQYLWDTDVPILSKVDTKYQVPGELFKARLEQNTGWLTLKQYHDMCKIDIHLITSQGRNGWHGISLTGFVKPLGYTIPMLVEHLRNRPTALLPHETDQERLFRILVAEEMEKASCSASSAEVSNSTSPTESSPEDSLPSPNTSSVIGSSVGEG